MYFNGGRSHRHEFCTSTQYGLPVNFTRTSSFIRRITNNVVEYQYFFTKHSPKSVSIDTRWVMCLYKWPGYPRTGGAAQDVHVAPGYGPWKQTSSRSITVWIQPGDSLRTEDDGSNSWKRLRSSQGHARDDDDDDDFQQPSRPKLC